MISLRRGGRFGLLVGWWGLWLGLALGGGSARAQPGTPAQRVSLARVRALLNKVSAGEAASWAAAQPTKDVARRTEAENTAAFRQERERLWARRRQWAAESLAFVVWARLATAAAVQQQPDTGLAYLRRALAANRRVPGYALDAAELNHRLSSYYWTQQAYDSALACHRREISALKASGFRADARQRQPLALGDSLHVGIALAGAYANAGLALRRRGNYAGAVRDYAQGLRHYQQLHDYAGLVWLNELLGEAYEEQGNDERAERYYTAARRTARALQATEPTTAAVDLAEALGYTHALLLRQRRAPELLRLLAGGIAEAQRARQRDTAYWRLAGIEASLRLRVAEVSLRTGQPAQAAAALRRAAPGLAEVTRRAPTPALRQHFLYYTWRAQELVLLHWLARATARPPNPAWVPQALACTDSLDALAGRAALRLQLADYLLQAGEPASAATLLPAVETSYRAAHNRVKLREVLQLKADALVALGRWERAYHAREQLDGLTDSLRATQQYAALADMETRYQTENKETQIRQLRVHNAQEQRQKRLAWAGAALLALLLAGATYTLLLTRRLTRRLREARATQDRLYSVIGHDLRSPLAALGGLATLLDYYRQAGAADPAALEEVTTEVRQTTSQLTALVDNLLHWAASQSGELAYRPEGLDAARLLHEVAALYASEARARQVRVAVEVPAGLRRLWADHNMVRAQLRNLLGNALKVAPPGSAIALAAHQNDRRITLRVADAGPGLSAAELATLQTSNTPTGLAPRLPGQRGTGLGLPLVRQLARRQQGGFRLESTPGQGTVAYVELPVAKE
nr:tetratricopeptide repeat-containing sensor histidine kinase [Hymenobacter ruricola]